MSQLIKRRAKEATWQSQTDFLQMNVNEQRVRYLCVTNRRCSKDDTAPPLAVGFRRESPARRRCGHRDKREEPVGTSCRVLACARLLTLAPLPTALQDAPRHEKRHYLLFHLNLIVSLAACARLSSKVAASFLNHRAVMQTIEDELL